MVEIKNYLESLNLSVGTKNVNVSVSDVVYKTHDLSIFKIMEKGNRPIDAEHVKQLKERMGEKMLRTIIIVNKMLEIIEGQHRYSAIKKINEENLLNGQPLVSIEFVICENYGVEECCEYNGKGKNWSNKNITEGAKILNIEEYIVYDDFLKKFNFPHNVTVGLLSQQTTGSKKTDDFKNLKLKIKDIDESLDRANKLNELVETGVIPIGKSDQPTSVFCLAMLDIFNIEGYEHDKMIHKCIEYVERTGKSLPKLSNIIEPLIEFEEIYNHKEKFRVTFISEKKKTDYLLKQMRK
jgi:hypothetical protein